MPISVKLHEPIEAVREPAQERILRRAIELLETVLQKPEFLDRVRGATYVRTGWKHPDGRRIALSRERVAGRIAEGRERGTAIDETVDLALKLRETSGSTIGSTTLGKLPIRPGYRFVDKCARKGKAGPLAGHLMHEWMHVSGFFHKYDGPQDDVPYVVGRIVRKLVAGQFLEEDDVELAAMAEELPCRCYEPDDAEAPVEDGNDLIEEEPQ